jgi:hypothetical protein
MVDHTGNMSEPLTQIQRTPSSTSKVEGPDTPTRGAGSGDVATDIVCGTQYVNGEKKDIIGLMSMDGKNRPKLICSVWFSIIRCEQDLI